MLQLDTLNSLRPWITHAIKNQKSIALVPTMGNLHEGHLVLVRRAKALTDLVGVSIFVNPLQFGPSEDFDRYPRTLKADLEKLKSEKVDFVFTPSVTELYPHQAEKPSAVIVPALSEIWCGAKRPGHFSGVATVVLKLFNLIQPNIVCFGEKDFQQLRVIQTMVQDFNLPIQVVPVETVREKDGLAMSSRNQYLNSTDRKKAPLLFQSLENIKTEINHGNTDFRALEANAIQFLSAHGFTVDYLAICDQISLALANQNGRLIVLAAAYLGNTRLIDNVKCE